MDLIPQFLKDYYLSNRITISDKLKASIICNSKALDYRQKINKLTELAKGDIHPTIKNQIENNIEDINTAYSTFCCNNGKEYRYVITDKKDKPLLVCECFPVVENVLNMKKNENIREYENVFVKLYKTENCREMLNNNDIQSIQIFDNKAISYIEVKNFTDYVYIKNELSDYIDWRIERENYYEKDYVENFRPGALNKIPIPYKVGGVVKNIYDNTFGIVRQINTDEIRYFDDLWLDVEFFPYQQNVDQRTIFSYKERVNVFDLDVSESEFRALDKDYQYKVS